MQLKLQQECQATSRILLHLQVVQVTQRFNELEHLKAFKGRLVYFCNDLKQKLSLVWKGMTLNYHDKKTKYHD